MSIKVKDADTIDRYYETINAGTSTNPFQSVVPDFRIAHAIRQIKKDFTVDVDVWSKGKSLMKFGRNPDLNGVTEMVWNTGGIETLKTANDIDNIVSSDAGDNQEVVIEGHTISSGDLTFVTQKATLNGTTNVALTTPLARVHRVYNNDSTDFAGTITVIDSGTSTNLTIPVGQNQSKKCASAISQNDFYIVTYLSGGVVGSVSANVNFAFQTKQTGKVWRTQYEFNTNTYTNVELNPCIIVPKNHDFRMVATSDTNNTEAVAQIKGYLAEVV